ncbi:MAG: 26 kDa periplasmic immunogenic protein precursor [Microgenomates bacterium OLB23]|nr:MAG: 26 kDa periplasmic immunogenic protein precursor [Microgenomates bacterium OLB23]
MLIILHTGHNLEQGPSLICYTHSMDKKLLRTYAALVGITLIGLLLIKELDIAYPLEVRTAPRSSELSVMGEGKVEAVPDTATVTVGISVANAAAVADAQARINEVNNKIIASMKEINIPAADIKTSNYSIYPSYANEPQQKISGYSGNVSVTIKTKDVSKVSEVVTRATAAGANEVHGVNFSIDNPDSLREQARDEAIKNAQEQAQRLAKQLGIRLGKVTNIIEADQGGVMPYYQKAVSMDAAMGGGGGANIEPGSQTITTTVTLFFEKR